MNRSNAHLFFLKAMITLTLLGSVVTRAAPTQNTPQSELAKARENFRISQVTCDRISAELERLKSSGKATPELIEDYENY